MLFNDLPDEMIDLIFFQTFCIEDVLRFSQVCRRWYHLACCRLNMVKYLMHISFDDTGVLSSCKRNMMFYSPENCDNLKIVQFFKFLPNLKILEINETNGTQGQLITDIFRLRPEVIGVWYHYPFKSNHPDVAKLATIVMETVNLPETSAIDRQLDIELTDQELWDALYELPDLKRLHIDFYSSNSFQSYSDKSFPNLEMLEMAILGSQGFETRESEHDQDNSFTFLIDSCPGLKSLYLSFIRVSSSACCHNVNEELENLVLEYEENSCQEWSSLFKFLLKYPNLKNLAIRGNNTLQDYHVRELMRRWDNLKSLDVRGCKKVTSWSLRYVDRHQFFNPVFEYYWGPLPKSYHDRANYKPICKNFDFMANVFNKSFPYIPIFLTPESHD